MLLVGTLYSVDRCGSLQSYAGSFGVNTEHCNKHLKCLSSIVLVGCFFGGLKHLEYISLSSSIIVPGCRTGAVYVLCPGPRKGQVFPTRVGGGRLWKQEWTFGVVLVKDTCCILCGALMLLPPSDHLENHIRRDRDLSWSPLRLAISIFKVIRLWYRGQAKHGGHTHAILLC